LFPCMGMDVTSGISHGNTTVFPLWEDRNWELRDLRVQIGRTELGFRGRKVRR